MTLVVIDENVLVVANDEALIESGKAPVCPQADDDCRLATIEFLREMSRTGIVVLDEEDAVISKYRSKMSGKGQPGSGDAFFRFLLENQYNGTRVRLISLEKHGGSTPHSHVMKT